MNRGMVIIAAIALGCLLCACKHHEQGKTPEGLKVINSFSPITGNAIDPNNVPPAYMRKYKGQIVGFCCAECVAQWDRLTDSERQAKLDTVMARQAAASQPASQPAAT